MTPKQILIVEDNADIRETLGMALLSFGYSVRQAVNGRDAVDQLQSGACSPTVILLDMMMPIMDGREFMAALRKLPAFDATSVILCSANRDLSDLAAELGVSGYLTKPVDYRELTQMIARLDLHALTASVPLGVSAESRQSVTVNRWFSAAAD